MGRLEPAGSDPIFEGLPEACRCGAEMVIAAGRNQRVSAYCPHCDRACPVVPKVACVKCHLQHARLPR